MALGTNDGWRVVTWSRELHNSDHWIKDCDACADDIVIDNLGHLDLLPPELRTYNGGGSGSEAVTTLTKNHVAGAPALSIHDGDVVYLTGKLKQTDRAGWLPAINTRKKRLDEVAPASTGGAASPCSPRYIIHSSPARSPNT